MKTQLQLSTAAVRANLRVRPSNKGRHAGLPLRFTRWIFLQFCIFAFLPTFAQTSAPNFTDPRDNQTYKTVIMPDGKRWMAENLRYRKGLNNPVFSNIPASSANTFVASKNLYYCPGPGPLNTSVGQADPLACEYWGMLYPFWVAYANVANTAVNTTLGEQGICPTGWHLPTDNEWNLLFTKIGSATDTGKLLKDTARGTFANNQAYKRYWVNSALQNNNTYGFSALAAGLRTTAGAYFGNGTQALFWTSTPNTNGTQASSKIFNHNSNAITGSSTQNRADALSVRCVEGGCEEGIRIPFTTSKFGSKTLDVAYDTVEFIPAQGKAFSYFVFSLPATGGVWRYTITPDVSTVPSGVSTSVANFPSRTTPSDSIYEILLKGLTPLNAGQTVHFSIIASNTNYCNIKQDLFITFKQYTGTTMTDSRDGKTYKTTIMPDGKEWMAENLNYQAGMTFRDASNLPNTTMNSGQGSLSFWCSGTDNKIGNPTKTTLDDCEKYGAFYTWDAAMWRDGNSANGAISGSYSSSLTIPATNNNQVGGRGICPSGWHVPSDNEWGIMLNAVETTNGNILSSTANPSGGKQNHNIGSISTLPALGIDAGKHLMHSWGPSVPTRTDQYNFSVLPAGFNVRTSFILRGTHASFWSASGYDGGSAWIRQFYFSYYYVERYYNNRAQGLSVRCVKD